MFNVQWLKPDFVGFGIDILSFAIGLDIIEPFVTIAVEDAVDGVFPRDVLDLSSTELVVFCERHRLGVAEFGNHLVPDVLACLDGGFVEPDLVEESA